MCSDSVMTAWGKKKKKKKIVNIDNRTNGTN